MIIDTREAKAAPVERDAAADFYTPHGREIIIERTSFQYSKYLTINITDGKEINLQELQKRFPQIAIFKLPHLELFKSSISIYRLDQKLRFKK